MILVLSTVKLRAGIPTEVNNLEVIYDSSSSVVTTTSCELSNVCSLLEEAKMSPIRDIQNKEVSSFTYQYEA